jgi:hypothetical protein
MMAPPGAQADAVAGLAVDQRARTSMSPMRYTAPCSMRCSSPLRSWAPLLARRMPLLLVSVRKNAPFW